VQHSRHLPPAVARPGADASAQQKHLFLALGKLLEAANPTAQQSR
jgi:hypothetical protein